MTRAFAAISAGGRSIEPYGITKVTTNGGQVLYRHQGAQPVELVPDYVAKGMTDLLQTAVSTGTGRAAQIGRPVAGKTGTTTSNKDGWFLGFSSGITTGVWMGRDDARTVPGLQGGTAPARAFASYMRYAVAKRPVEQFDTAVKLPEWQLEPDQEQIFGNPDDPYYYTDEQGNLVEPGAPDDRRTPLPPEDQDEQPFDPSRRVDPRFPAPVQPGRQAPPPAANDDFLDQATGRAVAPPAPRSTPFQGTRPTAAPTPRQAQPFGQ
jgi:penicillin-binding protein 1A